VQEVSDGHDARLDGLLVRRGGQVRDGMEPCGQAGQGAAGGTATGTVTRGCWFPGW